MNRQDCIYPDCLVKTDFGPACEHSCPYYRSQSLSRNQRRYLSRYVCYLCGMPLDRDDCGAIGMLDGGCSQQVRDKRRTDCLSQYRPRPRA
jgi:hypothetical protein